MFYVIATTPSKSSMSAVGVEVLRYWWDDYKKGQYIQLQYTVTKGCIVLSQVVNKSAYVGNANTCPVCAEAFAQHAEFRGGFQFRRVIYTAVQNNFSAAWCGNMQTTISFTIDREWRVGSGKKSLQKNYSVALCKV